jgi:hypothetical protein
LIFSLLRAEGFFCNLDVIYGGLGMGKLQLFYLKKIKVYKFYDVIFFQFLVIKAPGSGLVFSLNAIRIWMNEWMNEWIRIRNPLLMYRTSARKVPEYVLEWCKSGRIGIAPLFLYGRYLICNITRFQILS